MLVAAVGSDVRPPPIEGLSRALEGAEEWLGTGVAIEPVGVAHARLADRVVDPVCAAILETAGGGARGRIALELEPRIAAIVIERVLGGDGEGVAPDPGVLGEVERGVLAYAIARVLAAGAAGELRLAAVVTSPAALVVWVGDGVLACASARLRVGDRAGVVRAWMPDELVAWARGGRAPQAIEVGRTAIAAADLAGLAEGDVVTLDVVALDVVAHDVVPAASRPPSPPSAPSVELAAELVGLAAGEAARSAEPRALGARVALRDGDRVVAEGELVEVDGEIGVLVRALPRAGRRPGDHS